MEISYESDLLAVIKMLNTFGQHSGLVASYTELFGLTPLKNKRKKWRLLLEEVKRLFDSETFAFQKKTYRISKSGIVEAMNTVVHRNWSTCLENHNYLKKVMIGIAERETQTAGRQAEKDLRTREARLVDGRRDDGGHDDGHSMLAPNTKGMPKVSMTDEEREENRKRLQSLIRKIG